MMFTDLLDDYLHAKADLDKEKKDSSLSGDSFDYYNRFDIKRYDEAKEALNNFVDKTMKRALNNDNPV